MQRTPGMYTEINTQTQRTGLPNQSHSIVLITSDAQAPATPTPIYDTATADSVSGDNSNAGRMMAAALSVSQGVRVDTVGKSEPSDGSGGDFNGSGGADYESFDFSIKSDSATAFVTELYVSPVADAAWELKQDGVVIADHTGFLASNVTSTPDEWMEGGMTLAVSAATTDLKEYVLTGVLGYTRLRLPKSGNGSVVVSRFSQHIPDYRLSARDFNLQVPTSIPSSVKSLSFLGSKKFNQDIGMWDTSGLTDMAFMFFDCSSFNQPLDNWDVSNVTSMSFMFAQCSALTSVGLNWDVSKVTSMDSMFYHDVSLNCDFTNWNVSSVTDMNEMFYKCSLFDGAISTWTTTNLTNTKSMFAHCAVFNQPLNSWDMSKVTSMDQMFGECSSFNQPLDNWDISNVDVVMQSVFSGASAFNQDISAWDVSNIKYLNGFLENATSFNQDLSSWCVSSIPAKQSGFDDNTPAWTLPKPVWGTCPRG